MEKSLHLVRLAVSIGLLALALSAPSAFSGDLTPVFAIDKDTVANYSYTNKDLIAGPVKAVAIDMQGLSYQDLKVEPNPLDKALAEKSVLVVQPWLGPWNWSNFQAIRETDRIVAATLEKYGIGKDVPIVLYGRSMGGLSAYNYAMYGKFPVAGIAGNCPVTDFHFHATERPDVARGIYRAFTHYDTGIVLAVTIHCPMCQLARLPDVPYLVISSDADKSVNKAAHADKFVAALREKKFNVKYIEVSGMTHCQFDAPGQFESFPDVLGQYAGFISGFAK